MGISETLVIYLLIGAVVAAAVAVTQQRARVAGRLERGAELIACLLIWPLFAPGLFGRAVAGSSAAASAEPSEPNEPNEPSSPRLTQVQGRLLEAIRSLDGLGERVIRPQLSQIEAMMQSLTTAAGRLRDMEAMLGTPEFDVTRVDATLHELDARGLDDEEPRVRSLRARRHNIERLRAMRDRTDDELERALLRMEEISTQVLLLKFADQPESKLAGLLAEVSGSIEDLTGAVMEMSES